LQHAALGVNAAYVDESTYETTNLDDALKCVRLITGDNSFNPDTRGNMLQRACVLKQMSNGYISLVVKRERDDDHPTGWNGTKRGYWTFIYQHETEQEQEEVNYDDSIRCLQTPDSKPAGWMVKGRGEAWMTKSSGSVYNIFQAFGLSKTEASQQMGACELRPWEMVNIPFEVEYPGDRKWNIDAPQLAHRPLVEPGPHPHWDMILDHVGEQLDELCSEFEWAASGREYLTAWIAAAIREPFQPLPYLALYGPQNSGKSILHEAIQLLVTSGVVKADRSLTSKSDFNGELQGCVFAVVEEKDIARSPGAVNKIKDAVTAIWLSIRRMRTDTYMIRNTTHTQYGGNGKSPWTRMNDFEPNTVFTEAIESQLTEIDKQKYDMMIEYAEYLFDTYGSGGGAAADREPGTVYFGFMVHLEGWDNEMNNQGQFDKHAGEARKLADVFGSIRQRMDNLIMRVVSAAGLTSL